MRPPTPSPLGRAAERARSAPRPAAWLPAALLCALAGAAGALAAGAASGANALAQDQPVSPCTATVDKVAAPTRLLLGETTRITLTLEASCPADEAPIDVMLVLDSSASMADDAKLVNATAAARAFVDAMNLTASRVGLVVFNEDAGVRQRLTGDGAAVRSALSGLIAGGRTNVSQAIEVARAHLAEAGDPDRTRAIIVLTDGRNTISGAEPIPDAAARAKADGVLVATFCAGGQCDPDLEPAATSRDLYFNVTDVTELAALYATLAGRLQQNALRTLTVRDVLPPNMYCLGGTGRPEPDTVATDPATGTTTLTWVLAGGMPPGGLSYDVEPLEVGVHETNVVATADFVDKKGLPGQATFPVPEVEVLAPVCLPRPLEVYFLIDDSTCLLNSSLNGMAAVDAIAKGVEAVLETMKLGRDTAAVIGFGDTAEIYQTLTIDQEALVAAARRVAMRDGQANLDLAYDEVRRELRSPRHRPLAQLVTVTVTDGPMMASPRRAEVRAEQLRGMGARHYNIGVGPIVQHATLRGIAEPGGYRDIPLGGDVITAYQELGAMFVPLGRDCVPVAELTPAATAAPTATPPPGEPPVVHRVLLPWGGSP